MGKRFHFSVLVIVLLMGVLLSTTLAEMTAVNLTVSDRGVAFSLMKQTASSFFSVSVGEVNTYQPASRPTEVFPLLYVAAETNQPPEKVWSQKKQHGWGRTAKDYGFSPNSHGKYMSNRHKKKYQSVLMMNDSDFQNVSVVRFLCEYYATDPTMIFYWRDRGLSYDDIFVGVNLAARLDRQPKEFFEYRVSGRDWRYIAGKYHISYDLLSQPVAPRQKLKVKQDQDKPDSFQKDDQKGPSKQYRKSKHKK